MNQINQEHVGLPHPKPHTFTSAKLPSVTLKSPNIIQRQNCNSNQKLSFSQVILQLTLTLMLVDLFFFECLFVLLLQTWVSREVIYKLRAASPVKDLSGFHLILLKDRYKKKSPCVPLFLGIFFLTTGNCLEHFRDMS